MARMMVRGLGQSPGAGFAPFERNMEMRELTTKEVEEVGGGFFPALIAIGIALATGGCATTGGLRKGEKPSDTEVVPE